MSGDMTLLRFEMPRLAVAIRFALALLFAGVAAACARPAALPVSGPEAGTTAAELAVYRTVADSVYLRATAGAQRIAIARTVMDSTCALGTCEPITTAPLLTPRVLQGSAPTVDDVATFMRDAAAIRLDAVAYDHPLLVAIDAADIPLATADTSTWTYFRGNYGGISGVLRFSPVAFADGGRDAVVSVLWQCGPACGHALTVTLRSRADGEWAIADMLLAPGGGLGPAVQER
jgi:hypothetical protein